MDSDDSTEEGEVTSDEESADENPNRSTKTRMSPLKTPPPAPMAQAAFGFTPAQQMMIPGANLNGQPLVMVTPEVARSLGIVPPSVGGRQTEASIHVHQGTGDVSVSLADTDYSNGLPDPDQFLASHLASGKAEAVVDEDLTSLSWFHRRSGNKRTDTNAKDRRTKAGKERSNVTSPLMGKGDRWDHQEQGQWMPCRNAEQGSAPGTGRNSNEVEVNAAQRRKKAKLCGNVADYDPIVDSDVKPPFPFGLLIFMALEDSTENQLPVKGIYQWIMENFPYFQKTSVSWQNTIRHNLSMNKSFKKLAKSLNQRTAEWAVDPATRPQLVESLLRIPCCASSAGAHGPQPWSAALRSHQTTVDATSRTPSGIVVSSEQAETVDIASRGVDVSCKDAALVHDAVAAHNGGSASGEGATSRLGLDADLLPDGHTTARLLTASDWGETEDWRGKSHVKKVRGGVRGGRGRAPGTRRPRGRARGSGRARELHVSPAPPGADPTELGELWSAALSVGVPAAQLSGAGGDARSGIYSSRPPHSTQNGSLHLHRDSPIRSSPGIPQNVVTSAGDTHSTRHSEMSALPEELSLAKVQRPVLSGSGVNSPRRPKVAVVPTNTPLSRQQRTVAPARSISSPQSRQLSAQVHNVILASRSGSLPVEDDSDLFCPKTALPAERVVSSSRLKVAITPSNASSISGRQVAASAADTCDNDEQKLVIAELPAPTEPDVPKKRRRWRRDHTYGFARDGLCRPHLGSEVDSRLVVISCYPAEEHNYRTRDPTEPAPPQVAAGHMTPSGHLIGEAQNEDDDLLSDDDDDNSSCHSEPDRLSCDVPATGGAQPGAARAGTDPGAGRSEGGADDELDLAVGGAGVAVPRSWVTAELARTGFGTGTRRPILSGPYVLS